MGMAQVHIALGSNLGNRQAALDEAVRRMEAIPRLRVTARSRTIESPALLAPGDAIAQPDYLNAVVQVETDLSPRALLTHLQAIEEAMGRLRTVRWAPRVIDLDIVLWEQLVLEDAGLVIPHPQMHRRRFVLDPLVELVPWAVHPQLGLTVAELHSACVLGHSHELRATVEMGEGARETLAQTVAALRRPAAFPGHVETVEALETHMSWVFLTETHAFKLKKAIRTSSFDHSTLEARRKACEAEVLLNRRLAPSVYLGVVPLAQGEAGLRVEGEGETADWLVKMRRLPPSRMLDTCIRQQTVEPADVDRLAQVLLCFYRGAQRAPVDAVSYRRRSLADIEAKRVCLLQPRYGLPTATISKAVEGLQRWVTAHGALLEKRSSFVVDGHGDLRPEHICLEAPPVVIDCLEFNRSLRLLDPISELSFLALECRRLNAAWVGAQLLERYCSLSGDSCPPALFGFYECLHAVVRAAVAVWHLDDDALGQAEHWRQRARDYLDLAEIPQW